MPPNVPPHEINRLGRSLARSLFIRGLSAGRDRFFEMSCCLIGHTERDAAELGSVGGRKEIGGLYSFGFVRIGTVSAFRVGPLRDKYAVYDQGNADQERKDPDDPQAAEDGCGGLRNAAAGDDTFHQHEQHEHPANDGGDP